MEMFGNNDVNTHNRLLVLFGHDFAFGYSSGSHHMTPFQKKTAIALATSVEQLFTMIQCVQLVFVCIFCICPVYVSGQLLVWIGIKTGRAKTVVWTETIFIINTVFK